MKFSFYIKTTFAVILAAITLQTTGCNRMNMKITTMPYTETRMDDVRDDYHGTVVADPYRWLEDDNSEETAAWVKAQNEVTFDYLSRIPYREKVKERITRLMDYPKEGLPSKHGQWYYFSYNDGLQDQSVVYRSSTAAGEDAEVFLDPNKFSADGTVALGSTRFSEDGKYMAYSVSTAGSDWVEIKVMDTETLEPLADRIEWVKFSGANWAADSKGFYYSRYDQPAQGTALSGKNEYQKVYYHRLGDDQASDQLIYMDSRYPLRYFHGGESEDGKYIFISASEGTHGSEILYRETAARNAPFKVLLPGFENDYGLVYCKDDIAYIYTNEDAPNYKVISINLKEGRSSAKTLIAETDNTLVGVSDVGGYLFASYLENAVSSIYQYDLQGSLVRKVELPGIGSAGGFYGKEEATETYYAVTSFTSPSTIYTYDLAEGTSTLLKKPQVNFDIDKFTTEQAFFTSKDGEKVPMFIVHRKDMKKDGENPLHLYGYGGFNISMTPSFSPTVMMFLEQGGIYVMVNLRGGGEYGERWHRAGMLENKQNVFDDFISAAEYLIENKYTSPEKLAISGGSNGGLLVGACMTQRPELFAVAVPQVGVLDMLRYHRFTIGWGWAVEYGSADDAEQFDYIYKYSPLHNIREGVCYPATFITTGDHDDRVVPAHSFKFAAALQAAQDCDNPTLIRIETNAGHGAGKPTSKRIEEAADIYSFIFWNTGSKVKF
ncbi:MAG: prolyl oligopeptidase family serine peptidase [Rikenellaceae bacterium]|nr:prolyl oligopeptidase family serine peptidase [Rikenellaceae bacterium]